MKFIKKETIYTYQMTSTELLVLTGILVELRDKGEVKITDKESEKFICNILNSLKD